MAPHVDGPLHYERMGRSGPLMAFIHPNPMDQSSWIYQLAHLSTWFRTVAIDLPGYGRSPTAATGLTMRDLAAACWEAVDDVGPGEPAIIVGSSVGSAVAQYMHHEHPDRTRALVLSGTGYSPNKEFAARRIDAYTREGLDYRWRYTFEDLSPAFQATPLAAFFADLFTERDPQADLDSILHQFRALQQPDPEDHHARIACPTLILTGSEDAVHERSFALQDRIPGCELRVLPGAGHACHMEQPWLFDRLLIEFLRRHDLLPAA